MKIKIIDDIEDVDDDTIYYDGEGDLWNQINNIFRKEKEKRGKNNES